MEEQMWVSMSQFYKYDTIKKIGYGAYGTDMKCIYTPTGKKYAVKLIKNSFDNDYMARQLYREVKILRELSQMDKNVLTVNIHDILIPH